MAAEEILSAAERQALIDRRLDEIDRALLGLLPRSERLAIVADVEARVQAVGNIDSLLRELPTETAVASSTTFATRSRAHRSRLAFSAGVLGIVAASCLVASPLLLVGLSAFGELLGETFSIVLFGLLTATIALGGALAVCGGGVSLFRLGRRGQSATGTGWAITGLCTGALPMLLGLVGVAALLATVLPSQTVEVTWNASPASPVPYQGVVHPGTYPPPGMAMVPPPYMSPNAPPPTWVRAAPSAPLAPKLPLPKEEPVVKPEPKPELQELPSLPLDEPVGIED